MSETPTPEELAGLRLPELFDQLAPIAPPPEVSMLPQTPAWAALALLLLGALAFALWTARKRHAANAYRRAGLAALAEAGQDPAAIATVLRRTALAAYPRAEVAGLDGAEWLAFLDRTAPSAGFGETRNARMLLTGPYARQPLPPAPELARLAKHWIESHRV